jgi:hypothetical protein
MKKPKPATPPDHVVADIRNNAYDSVGSRIKPVKIENDDRKYFVEVKVKPPVFHCVPGRRLNWSTAHGFAIDPVQAIAICGVQPNPHDPIYVNNGWDPKFWVQELDPKVEVSCNKCLALMRARLRVKSRGCFVLALSEAEGRATVRTMRNHRNDCWPSNAKPLQNVKTLAEKGWRARIDTHACRLFGGGAFVTAAQS